MKHVTIVGFVLVLLFLSSACSTSVYYRRAESRRDSGVSAAESSQDPADWWPMFHHDATHTGYSTSPRPITNNTLWTYNVLDKSWGLESSPAVVGGLVYVGSDDGNVYSLNATNGALAWNYTTGDWVNSSPAVAGGLVYLGSNDNSTYCLNATTGAFVWRYKTGNAVYSSPAVAGGVVYVGSDDTNVYALNAATGAKLWNYTTGGWVFSSPAVVGGVVYVGSGDGNVYALNSSSGGLIWNFTTGSYVASSPTVAGGVVYVGSEDHKLYALNAATGGLIWSFLTGSLVDASPTVAQGLAFVTSDDGNIYAFSGFPSSTSVVCSPSLVSAGSHVDCSATVSGSNATGSVSWSTSSSTGYFSQPVCALSSGNCSTTYIDNNTGYVTITASYSGDSNNLPSSGNTTLTVFINVTTGTNVTVTPTNSLTLTFTNVTAAGTVVANATPTVQAPALDLVGPCYNINVTASFSGNVTVSLAFDGSSMTQQQKGNLTMNQYTPIPGDVVAPFGVVDIRDVHYIAIYYGTTRSSPNWNPNADLNGDGKVDIRDVHIAAVNYGKTANWINITTYVDTTNNIIYGNTTHFSFIGIH